MGLFKVSEAEIAACEQAMRNVESDAPSDVVQCLAEIHATLAKLSSGKEMERQIEKLLLAGNADRAVKLLRAHPRTRRLVGRVPAILAPLGVVVVVPLVGQVMPRCDGAYRPALAALNDCPAATTLLGSPIRQSIVGYACGESETGVGSGHASWTMLVSGPNGSGTFSYSGEKRGGPWQIVNAQLKAGGGVHQVVPCVPLGVAAEAVPGTDRGVTDRLRVGSEFEGRVTSVTGHTSVAEETACTIAVSPSPEAARKRGYNCHVKVRCGTQVLYGWEGAGMTRCRLEDSIVVAALDAEGAAQNDDPMLDLVVADGRVIVSDNGTDATYRVEIALDGGSG
ncbi:MAG: hypothetical protein JRI25_16240 [Deltaproteobacteria bacterium]|nr:hypothetical protein [Deltaproteobacteria bacterium]MBW2256130.1 hypothetical protein [Deltaproteobacteria bacterium]